MRFLSKLKQLLESNAHEALDEASKLAGSVPHICKESSEFLSITARVCAMNRLWGLCQLLSIRALEVNTFETEQSAHWASSLFALTAGCDLIARVYPEARGSHKINALEQLAIVFAWFDAAIQMDQSAASSERRELGKEFKLEFLMLITGYMDFPPKIKALVRSELSKLEKWATSYGRPQAVSDRLRRMEDTSANDWVLQIDASEVGNEARYANHADNPNGILVKRCANRCSPCPEGITCSHFYPNIVALRNITKGDEITINYGASYWSTVQPGADTLLLGSVITEPFTDCIYYDGVLEDFTCSPAPGGLLIPPHETEKRRRKTDSLSVMRVPKNHPAYPGFGLYASRNFARGEIICLYGGIVDSSPHSGRHASKYTVDLSCDPGIGSYGFHFDTQTLEVKSRQEFMPFLTDFRDISIPGDGHLVGGVHHIREAGTDVTKVICRGLTIPKFRATILEKLKMIPAPFAKPTKRDEENWGRMVRKTFGDLLTKPPIRFAPESFVGERNEPELVILLDN